MAGPYVTKASGDALQASEWNELTDDLEGLTLADISDSGTAASKDVPASGDAAATEVVQGDDTRLSDARTPTDHEHTLSDITDYSAEVGVNDQTGTAYTLVLADQDKIVRMDNAAANTVTVPPESAASFPIGAVVMISQVGAGQTTVAAGTGVTVNGAAMSLASQWASASLIKVAADEWDLYGNVA